jgi:hypothetical protein
MDWDTALMKRAKHDLLGFKSFNNLKVKGNHAIIQIKEGKYSLKRMYKHDPDGLFYPREKYINKLLHLIDVSDLPDVQVPINLYDSYEWDGDFSFVWAKPYNKNGLLFPSWEFDEWNKKVKEFDDEYIAWDERSDTPYFKGRNTTEKSSNLRHILQDMYPEYILLDKLTTDNEAKYKKTKEYEPITTLMKHKIVFDLPGNKPWSVRTPYIYLSGSTSLRIFQYYPRWGEKQWIQFFEDPKDLHGIMIEGNYDKPLKQEQVKYLEDEMPKQLRLLQGKRAQNRAEKMRERMKSLTTKHMLTYIKFICNYIGEKQDL